MILNLRQFVAAAALASLSFSMSVPLSMSLQAGADIMRDRASPVEPAGQLQPRQNDKPSAQEPAMACEFCGHTSSGSS